MVRLDDRGFTLPELIFVVGFLVIAGIAASFLLRPADFSAESLQAGRRTDIAAIVQALHKYESKNGSLPSNIPTMATDMGSFSGEYNMCHYLVPAYLTNFPIDSAIGMTPTGSKGCDAVGAQYDSGYTISRNSSGQVTVGSAADLSLHLQVP